MSRTLIKIESAVIPLTADSEEGAGPDSATGSPSSTSWRLDAAAVTSQRRGIPTPEQVRDDGHRAGCPF